MSRKTAKDLNDFIAKFPRGKTATITYDTQGRWVTAQVRNGDDVLAYEKRPENAQHDLELEAKAIAKRLHDAGHAHEEPVDATPHK